MGNPYDVLKAFKPEQDWLAKLKTMPREERGRLIYEALLSELPRIADCLSSAVDDAAPLVSSMSCLDTMWQVIREYLETHQLVQS
jgi:hypothetical protein